MNTPSASDSIERSIHIRANRARVWHVLTDAEQFGTWFGADLAGQTFQPGQRTRGRITVCGHEHAWFDVVIETLQPQVLMAFRWHPYSVDPGVDYAAETPTLVTFTLADGPDNGTVLRVIESGFDKLPPDRRQQAFRMNSLGWDPQLNNLARHATPA